MDKFDIFNLHLLQVAEKVIGSVFQGNKDELKETVWNELFDLKGKKVIDREPSQKELFFGKVFWGFLEIDKCYVSLNDCEVYIGRFPYSKTPISKTRHLRYHVANYMDEMYILKQRLIAYLTKIGRLYKKDQRHHQILQSTKPVFKIVNDTLSGIIKTRGTHVHQSRYQDKDLDQLDLLELLVQSGSKDISEWLSSHYDFTYKRIRRKWKNTIKKNNEEVRKLFNLYFGTLLDIFFDKNGNLIYPQALN